MIAAGAGNAVFTDSADGDMRSASARRELSSRLGIPAEWATARQVHGPAVRRAESTGVVGEADALWTDVPRLPVAVLTADCFGIVISAGRAVGVAHAGWRGTRSGVVRELIRELAEAGHHATRAAVGPGIGPCCFEVGDDVADEFDRLASTTWGAPSVDLRAEIEDQLDGMATWWLEGCTHHTPGFFSHRRDGEAARMAALAWL